MIKAPIVLQTRCFWNLSGYEKTWQVQGLEELERLGRPTPWDESLDFGVYGLKTEGLELRFKV